MLVGGTYLTSEYCFTVKDPNGCYKNEFEEKWESCGGLCNGALLIGPNGRRCQEHCKRQFNLSLCVEQLRSRVSKNQTVCYFFGGMH